MALKPIALELEFIKYQGAGNDFIMIDNFKGTIDRKDLTVSKVSHLCDRHYGIGADGLIILEKHSEYDFHMVYHNSDGQLSSMCGNGGRCIIDMAFRLGYVDKECTFLAADGPHMGAVGDGEIHLKMRDVFRIETISETDFFVDTGSPHYVQFVDVPLDSLDIVTIAKKIRYNDTYKEEGTNVNFVRILDEGHLAIRTYERGVEDETLACGTGITAAALAYDFQLKKLNSVSVRAQGGELSVRHSRGKMGWEDVWLSGPAKEAFRGVVAI